MEAMAVGVPIVTSYHSSDARSLVESGAAATVYFEGTITGLTGLTAGRRFLSTTPGVSTSAAPSAAGNVVQVVGFATSATTLNFNSGPPVMLA